MSEIDNALDAFEHLGAGAARGVVSAAERDEFIRQMRDRGEDVGLWTSAEMRQLRTFSKSLDYRETRMGDVMIESLGIEEYLQFMARSGSANPVQDMLIHSMKSIHKEAGTQFVVDEGVSKELSVTDLSRIQPDVLPWPSTTVEFFFEEPGLPTVLVYQGPMVDFFDRYKATSAFDPNGAQSQWRDNTNIIVFLVEARPPKGYSIHQSRMMIVDSTESWHAVMEDVSDTHSVLTHGGDEIGMSMAECFGDLLDVFRLCIKSLVYASIPRYSKKMYHGKKHRARSGVKKRPHRPVQRVIYLPKVIRPSSTDAPGNEKRAFNGRRGHIRYYGHDRYVKKQGTFDYIPPILGPNGELPKTIYKVRKVS